MTGYLFTYILCTHKLRAGDYWCTPTWCHQSECPMSLRRESLSFISDEERWATSLLCRGCFRCRRCSLCVVSVKRVESMGFLNKETIPHAVYPVHPFLPLPKRAAFPLILTSVQSLCLANLISIILINRSMTNIKYDLLLLLLNVITDDIINHILFK